MLVGAAVVRHALAGARAEAELLAFVVALAALGAVFMAGERHRVLDDRDLVEAAVAVDELTVLRACRVGERVVAAGLEDVGVLIREVAVVAHGAALQRAFAAVAIACADVIAAGA